MTSVYVVGGFIAVAFIVLKIIELRFIQKDEDRPIKEVCKDGIIVYLAVLAANFVISQFGTITTKIGGTAAAYPPIFTDMPNF